MTEPTDAEKLAYLTYDAQHPETRRSSAAPAGLLREADKMEAELLEATRATRRAPNIVLLSWRETVRDLRAALAATGDSEGPDEAWPEGKHRHDDGCPHLPRVPWNNPKVKP